MASSSDLLSSLLNKDDTCAGNCGKMTELQQCSKCKSVKYCSKECQKKDWKAHKKLCPVLAQMRATQGAGAEASGAGGGPSSSAGAGSERIKNLETPISKPFHKLDSGTWLHGRTEKDVFQLLIDSFRLRLDDEYNFRGDVEMDTIYDGSADSSRAFKRYLRKVERKTGLLPPWWNDAKAKECVRFGLRQDQWADLRSAVTKGGIVEYYASPLMPMQLRMLAEDVLGSSISSMGGAKAMRQFQMMQEASSDSLDGFDVTHMDLGQ
jgi:splicing suppressor protein 51